MKTCVILCYWSSLNRPGCFCTMVALASNLIEDWLCSAFCPNCYKPVCLDDKNDAREKPDSQAIPQLTKAFRFGAVTGSKTSDDVTQMKAVVHWPNQLACFAFITKHLTFNTQHKIYTNLASSAVDGVTGPG